MLAASSLASAGASWGTHAAGLPKTLTTFNQHLAAAAIRVPLTTVGQIVGGADIHEALRDGGVSLVLAPGASYGAFQIGELGADLFGSTLLHGVSSAAVGGVRSVLLGRDIGSGMLSGATGGMVAHLAAHAMIDPKERPEDATGRAALSSLAGTLAGGLLGGDPTAAALTANSVVTYNDMAHLGPVQGRTGAPLTETEREAEDILAHLHDEARHDGGVGYYLPADEDLTAADRIARQLYADAYMDDGAFPVPTGVTADRVMLLWEPRSVSTTVRLGDSVWGQSALSAAHHMDTTYLGGVADRSCRFVLDTRWGNTLNMVPVLGPSSYWTCTGFLNRPVTPEMLAAEAIGLSRLKVAAGFLRLNQRLSFHDMVPAPAAPSRDYGIGYRMPGAVVNDVTGSLRPTPLHVLRGTSQVSTRELLFGTDRVVTFSNQRVRPIGGRMPINAQYAGRTYYFDRAWLERRLEGVTDQSTIRELQTIVRHYTHGVPFSGAGRADFSRYAIRKVQVRFSGDSKLDIRNANRAMGWSQTPQGFTWHHDNDGRTLMLIQQRLHEAARHTGGDAIVRALGGRG